SPTAGWRLRAATRPTHSGFSPSTFRGFLAARMPTMREPFSTGYADENVARTGVFCQWAARVVWVVVCFGMAREAQAAARRVALVQADPELLRSVSIALTPWG